MRDTLLVELLTEELPPKSLESLGSRFAEGIGKRLQELGFVEAGTGVTAYSSPRRLAVSIEAVLGEQPDREVERKGPAVASGIGPDGKPTKALEGFARSCGVAVDALDKMRDGKAEYFVFRSRKAGEAIDAHLAGIVQAAIKELPIPKLMRWGEREDLFVRPVHGLVQLHGARVVPGEVLGQQAGNTTRGHRFLAAGELRIEHARDYAPHPGNQGRRCRELRDTPRAHRRASGARPRATPAWADHDALLNESHGRWSRVQPSTSGRFDEAFLAVPQECLILSMQQHQKYFPLLDRKSGRLLNRFLIVSNLATDDPRNIIAGNERVLRARLADAKFFFDQDRKVRLAERVDRLAAVVYHNKLGTQLERVQRIRKLAGAIAAKLRADSDKAERAAWLCKADLVSDMVGEFPELQGIMGEYYARHDGEDDTVAGAIEAHYHPRFASDTLPEDNVGAAVALADKLDTLVGIYGIGLVPTGDKDPFGLRRQALGVLRILAERALPLDLIELLQQARLNFATDVVRDSVAADLHAFMLERLRNYLRERGFAPDEVDSVVSQSPTRIDLVVPRLNAVQAFRKLPEAEALAAANKRIRNILKKTEVAGGEPDPALLQEPAEKSLHAATARLLPAVRSLVENEDYTEALRALAGVRAEVDTFFDQVMVMTDEPLIRNNRLALLAQLERLMNQVADISRLAPGPASSDR